METPIYEKLITDVKR